MNRTLEFDTNFRGNHSSSQYLLHQNRFNCPSNNGYEYGSSSTHGSHKKIPFFGGFSLNSSPIPYSFCDPFQNYWNNGIPKESNTSNPFQLPISNGTTNPQTTNELPNWPQRQVKKKPKGNIKGRWTIQEDSNLKRLMKQSGKKQWSVIASQLGGRVGKQCRDRWENHLDPILKKDKWSEEEQNNLIAAHKKVGTKWAELSRRFLPERSESSIKNLWNATEKRMATMQSQNSDSRRLSPLEDYITFLISNPVNEVDKRLNLNPKPEISDPIKSSSRITMPNSGSDYGVEEERDVLKVDDAYYPVYPNEKATLQNEEFDEQKEMDFLEMLINSY